MSDEKPKPKAAIYLRVSTEEQTERYGMDMQRSRCLKYCEFREWEVAEIYEDAGITGSTMNRPALQRLLLDARNGKWGVVVTYKVDRLSRNVRDLLTICEDHLMAGNKDLASCVEGIDTKTPIGRFFLSLLGIFAGLERETIKERTNAGRWEAAAQGVWVSGGTPFGYRKHERSDKKHVLAIEESEAEVVRRMFEWHTEESIGCQAIAERLNALGIQTPYQMRNNSRHRQAQAWTNSAVGRMLKNPLYMGEAYQHRMVGRKANARHPRETWIPISVPPIVSAVTFEKSRKMAANNRRVSGGKNKQSLQYLLRDVLYCGHCGGRLRGLYSNGCGEKKRYYRCGRQVLKKKGTEGRCILPFFSAISLEELVWQQVRNAIVDPDNLERYAKLDQEDVEALRAEIAVHDSRLGDIEKQRERLRWLFTRETISFEELERDLCTLDQQRREVNERKSGLEARLLQQEDIKARLGLLHDLMATLRSRIDVLDFDEKRLVLRDLGVRVTVYPDRSVQIDAVISDSERASITDPSSTARRPSPRTLRTGSG